MYRHEYMFFSMLCYLKETAIKLDQNNLFFFFFLYKILQTQIKSLGDGVPNQRGHTQFQQ